MSDLVVASNRGPFSLRAGADGSVVAAAAGGGLAPSLASALGQRDGEAVWVASPMNDFERRLGGEGAIDTELKGLALRLVEIGPSTYAAAYDVIANSTLWFCFHGLFDAPRRPVFDQAWREAWEEFRVYNSAFADRICDEASEGATVLVNDYHLPLVGKQLEERRPDLATVHFTHTPFATPEELETLPRDTRRELLEGMSGFGACGFHTQRWAERFREGASRFSDRVPETFAAGLGADAARLREVAASADCAERLAALEERVGDRRLIVRSDRIELSKNLLRGFLAFDALLEEREDLRGRVCLVARGYASREGLAEYLAYRSEVAHLVAVLNEKWTSRCGGEEPIVLDVDDDFAATVAALRRYDVLLVNPVRDGMNLVAKEGPVLNERDGLLVCSEQAGAFEEFADVALGVQPFDVSDTAAAMARALDMNDDERARRAAELKRRGAADPPARWLEVVLGEARRPSR
jgi:trehalose 6-phosphate synthase